MAAFQHWQNYGGTAMVLWQHPHGTLADLYNYWDCGKTKGELFLKKLFNARIFEVFQVCFSSLFGTLKFRLHFVQICSVLQTNPNKFGFVWHFPPNRRCSVLFRSEQNRTYPNKSEHTVKHLIPTHIMAVSHNSRHHPISGIFGPGHQNNRQLICAFNSRRI